MRLMTRAQVLDALDEGRLVIDFFEEHHLQHASYYFSLDARYRLPDDGGEDPEWHELPDANAYLRLQPGDYAHVRSRERFGLGPGLMGVFGSRSKMPWDNWQIVNAPFIDPGFPGPGMTGHLEVGLLLLGRQPGAIRVGDIIGKIAFFDLADNAPGYPSEESIIQQRFDEIVGRGSGDR